MAEYRLLTTWRYSWQGQLPCRVVFKVCATRIEKRVAIEGIAPVARSMFIRNHARVMVQGGEGLARLLSSSPVSQETIDLMAETVPPTAALGRWRERGQIDPATYGPL